MCTRTVKFKKGAILHEANSNTNSIELTVNSVPDNKSFTSRKKTCVTNNKLDNQKN